MNLLALLLAGTTMAAPARVIPQAHPVPKVVLKTPMVAANVVKALQAFYANTTHIRGEFRQVFTSTLYQSDGKPHDGKFWIKKPGKLYWQYDKPDKKYFISNGKDFWLYEPKNTQAFHQPIDGQTLPVAVSFLFGKGTLERDFNITDAMADKNDKTAKKYPEPGDHVLKLSPKKPQASYKYLYLVVDPKDFHVKQTVIVESGGDTNQIKFLKVESNPKTFISDAKFNFTPPKGVRVIEQAPATTPGSSVPDLQPTPTKPGPVKPAIPPVKGSTPPAKPTPAPAPKPTK